MKILAVADEESKYLWEYYEPSKLRDIDLIIGNADCTAGRFSIKAGIMVAVYIKHRNRRCIGQKVHIMPAQVPAADDQVDIAQLAGQH